MSIITAEHGTWDDLKFSARRSTVGSKKHNIKMKKNQHGANCSQSKHPTKYPVSKVSTTTNNGDGDEMVNNHESDTEPKCITLIVNGGTASYKKGVSNSYKSGEVMYIQNLLSESSNG